MKHIKLLSIFAVIATFCITGKVYSEESQQPTSKEQNQPLKVAIFTRNKSKNQDYDKYVDMLRNGLVSQLSGQFTIIDKDDVINVFEKESKKEKNIEIKDFGSFIQALVEMKRQEKEKDREGNVDNRPIDQKSSALRISQMIGANYFLIADLEEIVSNNIKDKVYGNQINDLRITADVAVKILDGVYGGSILADTIRVEKRLHGDEKTQFTKEDITQSLPLLMKQAAKDVSKKFLDNIDKIRAVKVENTPVGFSVKTNVKNVTVELDGTVIGTAPGNFQAISGLHRIRLTKDGYRSFERDVNLFDKAVISVSLEETNEAIERQDRKKDIELKEKRAKAENYYIKKKADAENKWGPKKEDW